MENSNYFMKYNDLDLERNYFKLDKSYIKKLLKDRNIKYSIFDFKGELITKLVEDDNKKRLDYIDKYKKKHIEDGKIELRQGSQKLKDKYVKEDIFDEYLDVIRKDRNILSKVIRDNPNFKTAKAGLFPDNISHIYWLYLIPNENPLQYPYIEEICMLCKLTNGNYVYTNMWQHLDGYYDRIEDQVYAYVAKNPEDLIKYAMSAREYYLYFKSTKPI